MGRTQNYFSVVAYSAPAKYWSKDWVKFSFESYSLPDAICLNVAQNLILLTVWPTQTFLSES